MPYPITTYLSLVLSISVFCVVHKKPQLALQRDELLGLSPMTSLFYLPPKYKQFISSFKVFAYKFLSSLQKIEKNLLQLINFYIKNFRGSAASLRTKDSIVTRQKKAKEFLNVINIL